MAKVGISLGSNLGDRLSHLREGIRRLQQLSSDHFLVSGIYETDPVDCPPDSPSFYNAVIEIETDLSPSELLGKTRSIEEVLGRPAKRERHSPRPLDLDLLYYDELVLSDEDLTLPHPRMGERAFVMLPLAEIRPNYADASQEFGGEEIRRLSESLLPEDSTVDSAKVKEKSPE